jgi:hypothetical protein
MTLTAYPHGISSFGVPQVGAGVIPVTSGSYFWVDSTEGVNGSGSFESPFSTLANAYAACTTAKGDVIIMKPGHAETISAATGVVLSKSGVSIIGLGNGALRPTFTLTGTAATCTFTVSGANQLLKNFIISCGVDELVAAITVSAANVTIDAVDYVEDDVTHQVLVFLLTTAAANYLTVQNCTLIQVTAPAGNGAAITLVGADDCKIMNNRIHWLTTNNAGSGGIQGLTTESLRMFIAGNLVDCQGGASVLGIAPLTSSTGIMAFNGASTANGAGSIVGRSTMLVMENYAGTTGTTSAILDPAAGV